MGKYTENLALLHHVGDETIVSAALQAIALKQKVRLSNCGVANEVWPHPAIARWWSNRTKSPQTSFASAKKASILHLPADKEFLAAMSNENFDPEVFINRYESYLRRKLAVRHVINPLLNIRDRKRHYVGRLSD